MHSTCVHIDGSKKFFLINFYGQGLKNVIWCTPYSMHTRMHTFMYTCFTCTPSVVLFLIVIDYIPWYMTCTVSKSVHTYIHNTYMTYAYLCTYYITKVRCSATVHEASHTCMYECTYCTNIHTYLYTDIHHTYIITMYVCVSHTRYMWYS